MSVALPEVVEKELAHYQNTIDLLHAGAIDADKVFRPFRLVHGVYGQRQPGEVQMVRIKLKYGVITPDQLRVLASTAEKYANGISHITTRQAIQFHYVPLDKTPALLRELEECGLTTREACGNAVRAVCGSPLAGTRADEIFNVDPYAEQCFQHFLRGPLSASLPRKFKISFGTTDADPLQQTNIQDVGITPVLKDGKQGFRVVVAGALGSSPQAPITVREFCEKADLLPVIEAAVRVHHKYGDRQNRAKARLKFVLRTKGDEGFRALIEEQVAEALKAGTKGAALPDTLPAANPTPIPITGSAAEQEWRQWNVKSHREAGYAVVSLCIRRGDLNPAEVRATADLGEKYSEGDIRSTNDQNLIFRRVKIADLSALYAGLVPLGYTRRAHTIVDVVSCPGASTCQLGLTLSKNLGKELEEVLASLPLDPGLQSAHINISGCPNSCGQHHIGTIGFHGASSKVGDKIVPHYVMLVGGGDDGATVTHASLIARIPARKIATVVKALSGWYLEERKAGEDFKAWLRRTAGQGLEKAAASAARVALKERIVPLCAISEDGLKDEDLYDIGSTQLFSASMAELGAGECMA